MPEQICDAFPPVTLAEVHAALAYYDHRVEIKAEMAAEEDFVEEFRHNHQVREGAKDVARNG